MNALLLFNHMSRRSSMHLSADVYSSCYSMEVVAHCSAENMSCMCFALPMYDFSGMVIDLTQSNAIALE